MKQWQNILQRARTFYYYIDDSSYSREVTGYSVAQSLISERIIFTIVWVWVRPFFGALSILSVAEANSALRVASARPVLLRGLVLRHRLSVLELQCKSKICSLPA
jgi:hypothetical protein